MAVSWRQKKAAKHRQAVHNVEKGVLAWRPNPHLVSQKPCNIKDYKTSHFKKPQA